MAKKEKLPTRVITGEGRFMYSHLLTPYKGEDDDEAKYSTVFAFPKTDKATLQLLKKAEHDAIQNALHDVFDGEFPEPGDYRSFIRDGDKDRKKDGNFKGMYFINVKSKYQPGLVGKDLQEIMDKDEIYAGMFGKLSATLFAYEYKGNKGVSGQINNVMKTRDGDKLSGNVLSAADEFAAVTTSYDDDEM